VVAKGQKSSEVAPRARRVGTLPTLAPRLGRPLGQPPI
jgi:hypothetical protein